ncbi:MAG: DUF2281 domain-containing protein [Lachnospiraceae bacterium]|nr:DUF2281 domain-containing protein [Lachnospiraceae bacterium]
MTSDILQKEVADMSEADINLLIDFARYLKYRVRNSSSQVAKEVADGSKKRRVGFLSDAFVSIAPDFDDALECMKEYI